MRTFVGIVQSGLFGSGSGRRVRGGYPWCIRTCTFIVIVFAIINITTLLWVSMFFVTCVLPMVGHVACGIRTRVCKHALRGWLGATLGTIEVYAMLVAGGRRSTRRSARRGERGRC